MAHFVEYTAREVKTMTRTKSINVILSLFVVSLVAAPVHAQSFTVLFSFNSINGAFPTAPVIRDSAGNLFGTTKFANPQTGAGNVFKLDPSGNESVLFQFTTRLPMSKVTDPRRQ